jgi:putative membrane protein
MFDLVMAAAHHLLVFGLFGLILAEYAMLRPGLDRLAVARLARLDLGYGLLAAAILVVGGIRAVYAAKGWAYYDDNLFFWLKLAAFVGIGLCSARPTLAFLRWKRAPQPPDDREVAALRIYLRLQMLLFALLLVFAAAMARGFGSGLGG